MKRPDSLFKFVTGDRAAMLANGKIRFTPAKEFNDPFELRPQLTHLTRCWIEHISTNCTADLQLDDDDYSFSLERDARLRDYQAKLDDRAMGTGILSLSASDASSENPSVFIGSPTDPRNNLLMWAHYGANHAGFVIEFGSDFVTGDAQQVKYSQARPIATFEDIDATGIPSHLRKSKEWEYENEWRLFKRLADADQILRLETGQEIHLFTFKKSAVKSITFGCRASEATRNTVLEALRAHDEYRDTRVFFAGLDEQSFKLSFHQEIQQDGRRWTNAPELQARAIAIQKRPGSY